MSRAKKYIEPDGTEHWFDYKGVATVQQLELLADFSGESIDDLLDAGLSQKEVARRLFAMDGMIPEHVLEARRRALAESQGQQCRWCAYHGLECEGRISRHHFVPRWLMLELENYEAYAPRRLCTIPVCTARHRDLHVRGGNPKSIVPYLNDRERRFAQRMLEELREQHPGTWELLEGGTDWAYEGQLIRDFHAGKFRETRVSTTEVSLADAV